MSKQPVVDLVDLIPFDVQFALTVNLDISIFEVTDIVSEWMSGVFKEQLIEWGYTAEQEYANFNRVILYDRQVRALNEEWTQVEELTPALRGDRNLAQGFLYTAKMGGHAAFSFSDEQPLAVPVADILEIQRRTLQNRTAMLLLQTELQKSDPDGLGSSLVALNSYLNPNDVGGGNAQAQDGSNDLEMVIVIAVGVACAAFLFLILAVIWAWRYDRRNRQAYLNSKGGRTGSDTTFEEDAARTTPNSSPRQDFPAVVDAADHYPDSVITDDIATSLSLYYQSGMANAMHGHRRPQGDAASVSSMESYGFSLDGYSPSVATPMPSDMPRALLQKKQEEAENEDEEDESVFEEEDEPAKDEESGSMKNDNEEDEEEQEDEEDEEEEQANNYEEESAFGDISTVYGEGGKPEF